MHIIELKLKILTFTVKEHLDIFSFFYLVLYPSRNEKIDISKRDRVVIFHTSFYESLVPRRGGTDYCESVKILILYRTRYLPGIYCFRWNRRILR